MLVTFPMYMDTHTRAHVTCTCTRATCENARARATIRSAPTTHRPHSCTLFFFPCCLRYIDSNFCNYFHRFKRNFSDPQAAKAFGTVVLLVLSGFAWLSMAVEVIVAFRKQLKMKARVLVDRDGDGEVEAHEVAIQTIENAFLRVQAFLAAVAAESIIGTALRFTLLMIPWPFYIAIFQVSTRERAWSTEPRTR